METTNRKKEDKNNSPLVSIITVVYNARETLENTFHSVFRQTYPHIEYLVIDGGSTDGTLELIERYESKIAYWSSEPDDGIYSAMNKGIKKTKGEILGILNADDMYYPEAVQMAVAAMNATSAEIVHGNMLSFSEFSSFCTFKTVRGSHDSLQKRQGICHPTCFVKKSIYKRVGNFNEAYQIAGDYDFLLRVQASGTKFHHIDKPMVVFKRGGASGSAKSDWEVLKIMKKYKLPERRKMFFRALKNNLKQKLSTWMRTSK